MWLHADVLSGPVHPKLMPLRSDYFLALCYRYFPRATISLGWTTHWIRRFPINSWQYEWNHVRQMADTVRCWYRDRKLPSLTFNVRGIFASRSIKQLQWLLQTIPHSTLTVSTEIGDSVNAIDFLRIQKYFPTEKVYFDVPETLFKPSRKFKTNSDAKKNYGSDVKWVPVTRHQDKTCETHTYVDDDFILFGRPSNTAVLQKNLILVDTNRNFSMTGRMKFFAGENTLNPTHWEHKLKIVLAEGSKFSKHAMSYSKKKLTISVRDPELLWSAVNSSVLYTFEHQYFQDNTACRMFKLDISTYLTFEAWTIPCDATFEDDSYEDVTKSSISEVALEESLGSQERMLMVGFHSYGEEYVLIYDLNVVGQENEVKSTLGLPELNLALTSKGAKLREGFLFVFTIFLSTKLCWTCRVHWL